MKPNVIIAGDELRAGVDMEDVEETGPIKNAIVITFESTEQLAAAVRSGTVDFDFMRCSDAHQEEGQRDDA